MSKTVRIGGASAMTGDWPGAVPQLLGDADGVDYLVLDYLAELTMSFLARAKAKRPNAGYARYFTERVWRENITTIAETGVRIVTNAGGLNPRTCRDRMREIASEAGISMRIAVVEGDDLRAGFDAFAGAGSAPEFGPTVTPPREALLSANAYLGAGPIVAALAAGADCVITGRVVDSALALGPLMYEFGWAPDDYDRLAAGSLAGHIIECGAQATGGTFTDWADVPDWANIGYPIVVCEDTGDLTVTKPRGTGGLCSDGTVREQILYEVGDPAGYVLPDVVCDFSHVAVTELGEDRVRVRGARGRPPTDTYKVCVTYTDGWRTTALLPVVGMNAADKARRQAAALLERFDRTLAARGVAPPRATGVEILGAEASYGHRARPVRTREVVSKIVVEHDDPDVVDRFVEEMFAPTVSMSVGTTGWFWEAPRRTPVVRVASYLVPKSAVSAVVAVDGRDRPVPAPRPGAVAAARPRVPSPAEDPVRADDDVVVALHELAYGRSGDKGNDFNVAVIARRPEYLPYVRAAVTESEVAAVFADDFSATEPPVVRRFDVPGLYALNFVCRNALGGGQMASMRLDALAKSKAQQLLELPVRVPHDLFGTSQIGETDG